MPITSSVVPRAQTLAPSEIRRIIFGLMMAMLLAALDQTIVATALPTIGRDLGDAVHLPWVVTAYLLSATSAVPIYGALSDIHGRRIMLLVSISTFLVGSVLCALAPTMTVLVVARLVQGAGGGGLLALSQTIVGDILTPGRGRVTSRISRRPSSRRVWPARCSAASSRSTSPGQ